MKLKAVGIALIAIGIAIAIGGGEIPVGYGDVTRQIELVKAYRLAKSMKRQTTEDEQGAYSRYIAYCVGGMLCAIGIFAVIVSTIIGD